MNITGSAIAKTTTHLQATNKSNTNNSANKTQNSRLDDLMDQRENLIKKKNALMAKTADKGQSLESIQEQLKIYDQQIQNLTTQIAKETKAAAKEVIKEKESDKNVNAECTVMPKTKEEINNQKLNAIAELGASFETVKTIDSIKGKMENEANITQSEINTDNRNRSDFIEHVSWTNPEAASLLNNQGASDNKYDKLEGIQQRIEELSQSLGNNLNAIQQEIEDNRLQDKIQALISMWNKADKSSTDEANQSSTSQSDSSNFSKKFEEAFKSLPKTTADFLTSYSQWNQEASEKRLTGEKKEDFLYDKLEEWEKNLQKRSPEQYESWKIVTSSLDVYA